MKRVLPIFLFLFALNAFSFDRMWLNLTTLSCTGELKNTKNGNVELSFKGHNFSQAVITFDLASDGLQPLYKISSNLPWYGNKPVIKTSEFAGEFSMRHHFPNESKVYIKPGIKFGDRITILSADQNNFEIEYFHETATPWGDWSGVLICEKLKKDKCREDIVANYITLTEIINNSNDINLKRDLLSVRDFISSLNSTCK